MDPKREGLCDIDPGKPRGKCAARSRGQSQVPNGGLRGLLEMPQEIPNTRQSRESKFIPLRISSAKNFLILLSPPPSLPSPLPKRED